MAFDQSISPTPIDHLNTDTDIGLVTAASAGCVCCRKAALPSVFSSGLGGEVVSGGCCCSRSLEQPVGVCQSPQLGFQYGSAAALAGVVRRHDSALLNDVGRPVLVSRPQNLTIKCWTAQAFEKRFLKDYALIDLKHFTMGDLRDSRFCLSRVWFNDLFLWSPNPELIDRVWFYDTKDYVMIPYHTHASLIPVLFVPYAGHRHGLPPKYLDQANVLPSLTPLEHLIAFVAAKASIRFAELLGVRQPFSSSICVRLMPDKQQGVVDLFPSPRGYPCSCHWFYMVLFGLPLELAQQTARFAGFPTCTGYFAAYASRKVGYRANSPPYYPPYTHYLRLLSGVPVAPAFAGSDLADDDTVDSSGPVTQDMLDGSISDSDLSDCSDFSGRSSSASQAPRQSSSPPWRCPQFWGYSNIQPIPKQLVRDLPFEPFPMTMNFVDCPMPVEPVVLEPVNHLKEITGFLTGEFVCRMRDQVQLGLFGPDARARALSAMVTELASFLSRSSAEHWDSRPTEPQADSVPQSTSDDIPVLLTTETVHGSQAFGADVPSSSSQFCPSQAPNHPTKEQVVGIGKVFTDLVLKAHACYLGLSGDVLTKFHNTVERYRTRDRGTPSLGLLEDLLDTIEMLPSSPSLTSSLSDASDWVCRFNDNLAPDEMARLDSEFWSMLKTRMTGQVIEPIKAIWAVHNRWRAQKRRGCQQSDCNDEQLTVPYDDLADDHDLVMAPGLPAFGRPKKADLERLRRLLDKTLDYGGCTFYQAFNFMKPVVKSYGFLDSVSILDETTGTNVLGLAPQCSCFGLALLLCWTKDKHQAFASALEQAMQLPSTDGRRGVTVEQALFFCRSLPMNVAFLMNPEDPLAPTQIIFVNDHVVDSRPTLLYFPFEGEGQAHWIAVRFKYKILTQRLCFGTDDQVIDTAPRARKRRSKQQVAPALPPAFVEPDDDGTVAGDGDFPWYQRSVRFAHPAPEVQQYVDNVMDLEDAERDGLVVEEQRVWNGLLALWAHVPTSPTPVTPLASVNLTRVVHCRSQTVPPVVGAELLVFGSARWHKVGNATEGNPSFYSDDSVPEMLEPLLLFTHQAYSLVELRPEALLNHRICANTLLFVRDQGRGLEPNMLEDGCYNPATIMTLECEGATFTLCRPMQTVYGPHRYFVYPIHMTAAGPLSTMSNLFPFSSYVVKSVGLYPVDRRLPLMSDLVGPSDSSKYRASYLLYTSKLPKYLQPILTDFRNEEQYLKKHSGLEPRDVAIQLADFAHRLPTPPAFGVTAMPKTCVCCGIEPPRKYRWKRRICNDCERLLSSTGSVCVAGNMIQAGLSVPSVAPGIVIRKGAELPPPAGKWASVKLTSASGEPLVFVNKEGLIRRSGVRGGKKRYEPVDIDFLHSIRGADNKTNNPALGTIGVSGCYPLVSAKTPYNDFKAIAGRVFRVPRYSPTSGVFDWLDQFVPLLLPAFEAPLWSFEQWLATMPSRRRVALRLAYDNYLETGWMAKYAKFKAFVKSEMMPDISKVPFEQGGTALALSDLDDMLDRLINGPHDVTHTIAGRKLKPLTERLKEIWSETGPIFYGACKPERLQDWLERLDAAGGTYVYCDYTMFDNTHSKQSWSFMRRLYHKAGETPLDFDHVMDAWERPCGTCGPFKFKAPKVMNASGRDDTGLSNGVLNGLVMYLSLCAAFLDKPLFDLTLHDVSQLLGSIFISVCGDDSLGRLPHVSDPVKFQRKVVENISLFGFEAKLGVTTHLTDTVYLAMRPYRSASGISWGKTIGRAMYKFGWTIAKQSEDIMAKLTGVAEMHAICSANVPILSDVAERVLELRRGCRRTPYVPDPNRPWTLPLARQKYDAVTLQSVLDVYTRKAEQVATWPCHASLLTMDQLTALIAEIQAVPTLPYVLDNELLRLIVHLDEL